MILHEFTPSTFRQARRFGSAPFDRNLELRVAIVDPAEPHCNEPGHPAEGPSCALLTLRRSLDNRNGSVKIRVSPGTFKLPMILAAITALSLAACVVLTDPAPSTLPGRLVQMLAGIASSTNSAVRASSNPPLDHFPIARALNAGPEVRDDYFVVGVELEGEARAYPLNMLSRPDHHVLDDVLGGVPIAVTWCGLCQSPLVYGRRVDDKTLTFFVSGELYGENMMMRDVETGSGWPQMLGEAIDGPLEGGTLQQIPSVWTDWKAWRTEHPDTTVVMIPQTVDYYRHDSEETIVPFEKRYFSNLQWGYVREGKAALVAVTRARQGRRGE